MSSEKRLALFMVLSLASILGVQYLMDALGLMPSAPNNNVAQKPAVVDPKKPGDPKKPADDLKSKAAGTNESVIRKDDPKAPAIADANDKAADKQDAPKPPVDSTPRVKASDLVLGVERGSSPADYRLEVRLDQSGAGVDSVDSSIYDSDRDGKRLKGRPLEIVRRNPNALPPFAIALKDVSTDRKIDDPSKAGLNLPVGEFPLGEQIWEVVKDEKGRIVHPISKASDDSKTKVDGQEILFRKSIEEPPIVLTKRYRLWKGEDGFELELGFESPQKERSLVYRLFGPHGIPIEGEGYSGTFRDVFFGQAKGTGTEIVTKTAQDIAKPKAAVFDNTSLPLQFAGIENQYFTCFIEPAPIPHTQEERCETETHATVIDMKTDAPQKADISIEMLSKPLRVGPNLAVTQNFRIYAGPKTIDSLTPFSATGLASYRKYQMFGIPGAAWMAMHVITPLLDRIHHMTTSVAKAFGGKTGNYGISIILLTVLVRSFMFPIGRKQALSAKRMQDLQPYMKEIQEKYKDDKERQTKETFALYRKHGVNPVAGCVPALIQLPIFVGLWQALNNSVHLRHASFLYVQNLAAPDMLFRLPFELPFGMGTYFNLLPFLVVALMLIQTKLFAPPPTTPEAEMQQKMMKYMMIFMAFMFYKVPSGLGLYFMTSSLWTIGERLLLPKVTRTTPVAGGDSGDGKLPPPGGGGGNGRGGPNGGGRGGPSNGPAKPPGRLAQLWEKVKEEAAKDSTHRNITRGGDEDRDRDRGKPRARPGRRR